MNYIVDTSVWSLALRRHSQVRSLEVRKLRTLLEEGERIFMVGVILQEILQGIKIKSQFIQIQDAMAFIPILSEKREDYFYAAELYNICRAKGIVAGTIDFLIASIAIRNECSLLTADRDFHHIAKHTKLKLL